MRITRNIIILLSFCSLVSSLQSCEGIFDNYDVPTENESSNSTQIEVKEQEEESDTSEIAPVKVTVTGELYIDASSWSKWYYIDLPTIVDSIYKHRSYDASSSVVSRDIPMTSTGEQTSTHPEGQPDGQYMYWFDIFGQGLSNNQFRYYTPTASQPAPDSWSFAIHRDDVRTNTGSALETTLTDIDQVKLSDYSQDTFTEDEWTENKVWSDNSQMLMKLVPSQGIKINKVLSSWLNMEITTPPPTFYHNNHVFILRLADSTYAALQLTNYISPTTGTKCCMTIKFKYPL